MGSLAPEGIATRPGALPLSEHRHLTGPPRAAACPGQPQHTPVPRRSRRLRGMRRRAKHLAAD
eukprot:4297050-Pyramimonas_sp.AAC.1